MTFPQMGAMPDPDGYAGPLMARSASAAEATAANHRRGDPEGDEDELDEAAERDLPGDRGRPTGQPPATGR